MKTGKFIAFPVLAIWIFSFPFCAGQPTSTPADSLVGTGTKDAGIRDLRLRSIETTSRTTALAVGQGHTVEAYITSNDEIYYGPLVFWMQEIEGRVIAIDSLGGVNYVLDQIQKEPANQQVEMLADISRALLIRQRVVSGVSTGIPLVGTYRARFLRAMRKALSGDNLHAVEANLTSPSFTRDADLWKNSWIEIDRLGGAERVTAEGSVSPWMVKRVLRESLFSAGTIPVSVIQASTVTDETR